MKRWSPPAACLFALFLGAAVAREPSTEEKLDTWIVPEVAMENLTLPQAVAWIREKSRALDPDGRGLRIGYQRPEFKEPTKLIRLSAEHISLGNLLETVASQSGRAVQVFDDGVVLLRETQNAEAGDRVTRTFWVSGPLDKLGPPRPEADPFAVPDPNAVAGKEGADLVRAILAANGIALPEDSAVVVSRHRGAEGYRLTVRAPEDLMILIDAFLATSDARPGACVVEMNAYAMTTDRSFAITRGQHAAPDATAIVRAIGDLIVRDEAELVATANVATQSSQRAQVENGSKRTLVTSYSESNGRDRADTETLVTGVSMEVDPVIAADGNSIDMNIAVTVSPSEPDVVRKEILAPVSGKPVQIDENRTPLGRIQTAVKARDGVPQLLGVIPATVGSDTSFVVIVTAWVRPDRDSFPVPE